MLPTKSFPQFPAFALACALALALAPACWGQYNIFLRVDGVSGDSTAAGHVGDIEGTGFSLGVSNTNTVSGGGGGSGKAIFADVSVTKFVDKASPLLMLRCAAGIHLQSVVLYVQSTSPSPLDYYKVTLTDALVKRLDTSGSVGGKPVETVSFAAASIEISYTPRNANGTPGTPIRACWDQLQNRTCP